MSATDEAQEEHKRFIEESYERIATLARNGYAQHGRGAVFMFEDAVLAVMAGAAATATIEYVADESEALRRRGGWPTAEHEELVKRYDPKASMIILVARRQHGRDLFTYQMAFVDSEPSLVTLTSRLGERDL